jgi:putative autoinducer-2 (AI-2) aldolase
MAMSIFIGSEHERQNVLNLAKLVDEGVRYGIPVLGVTAVGGELEKRDARYLSLACRMAAEFGAHFVKTYWCEEFERVAGTCPVPVVIAGGPKMETEMDVFRIAADAIANGAAGVDMGRNIWQNPHPEAMLHAVRTIVHDDATAEDAHSLFLELCEQEPDE